jgi:GT2 family glycosyltransferase/nucleoside-diphosphate-sugar epimerase
MTDALVSTVIVNYNAGPFLRACVDSLLASPMKIEIIVVDNASSDGSLEALRSLPQVQVIQNAANLGFAAGCNVGARRAGAEFLLFLNPDCFFKPSALGRLLEALRADERVGMVGGLLANPDGSEQAGGRRAVPTPWRSFVRAFGLVRFSNRWPRLFFDLHLHKQSLPQEPIEVEAISGACMLVRRESVLDVGDWDEGYFLHCEDLDWCMRFRKKGWKILFVPSARITHELGVCGRSRPVFVEWHKHKGMVRFYRKFFRHQYPGLLMLMVNAGVLLRFVGVAAFHGTVGLVRTLGFGDTAPTRPPRLAAARLAPVRAQPLEGKRVGVLGASSFVGAQLLPMLQEAGCQVTAFSRRAAAHAVDALDWRSLDPAAAAVLPVAGEDTIALWVCVAPIWILPQHFVLFEAHGVRRIVVLSSTSRFTKDDSNDPSEQLLAQQFVDAENRLREWAHARGIDWVILRPTLIYGMGQDKNISEIAHFIARFGFFPLFGQGRGLRQPVHASDVAAACFAALQSPGAQNHAYNLSGGEALAYREMVSRIFGALGRPPRFLRVPLWSFKLAVLLLRRIPRYRKWSSAMAERMGRDMVFDHSEAAHDLGFAPRAFDLRPTDVPAR